MELETPRNRTAVSYAEIAASNGLVGLARSMSLNETRNPFSYNPKFWQITFQMLLATW